MEIGRSYGADGFRYPSFVQSLTRGEQGFGTRTKDAWQISNGIAGLGSKTAGSVEAVRDNTADFLSVGGPPYRTIAAPLI